MRIIVGLRNPVPDYQGTRHNVGFEALEVLLSRRGTALGRGPLRVRSQIAQWRAGGDQVVAAAPLGFMNESGGPVSSLLRYFKSSPEDMLVLHDDIDLAFGRLRLQVDGGSGGHNGIKSLERSLATRDFSRLKIGVGRPPGRMDPAEFVLRRFSGSERREMDLVVEDAADVVEMWLDDPARAQQKAALRSPEAD